jgi:hypothetical protein
MKILHVITSLVRGGAESHATELALGQADRGATVSVAYLKDRPYWRDRLLKAGVAVEPLNMARYGDPRPVARLRAIMRSLRPDILHAHMPPAEAYARLALPSAVLPKLSSSRVTRTMFSIVA